MKSEDDKNQRCPRGLRQRVDQIEKPTDSSYEESGTPSSFSWKETKRGNIGFATKTKHSNKNHDMPFFSIICHHKGLLTLFKHHKSRRYTLEFTHVNRKPVCVCGETQHECTADHMEFNSLRFIYKCLESRTLCELLQGSTPTRDSHSLSDWPPLERGAGRCRCGGSSGRTAGFLPDSTARQHQYVLQCWSHTSAATQDGRERSGRPYCVEAVQQGERSELGMLQQEVVGQV